MKKHKSLTELAMEKKREAYQWRINADAKPSGFVDLRMAKRLDEEADALLAVQEPPITAMGEVAHPHIDGLRAEGRGIALDTLQYAGIIQEEASIRRTDLLIQEGVDIVSMAIDAAESIQAGNSLEKMLAHQMALAHDMAMRSGDAAMRELTRLKDGYSRRNDAGAEYQRLVNSTARLMNAFQQGLLTLQKIRTGGNQTMTVQHVHIEAGGQALIGPVQGGGAPGGDGKK